MPHSILGFESHFIQNFIILPDQKMFSSFDFELTFIILIVGRQVLECLVIETSQ